MKKLFLVMIAAVMLGFPAWAELKSLLILHTNDLHDHLRPDYDGKGGLPYMAGYVAGQRMQRNDVLLLDAGDAMEKGDLVAHKTQSRFTYELMALMGYHVVTVGNHDFAYGPDHLRECLSLLQGTDVVCANILDDEGSLLFRPSVVHEINGIRVGIIGLITDTDDAKVLPWPQTVKALKSEAARLKPETDLLVALVHLGKRECLALARECPDIHLFVGGHAHEILKEPVRADSGAWIVQAGCYGEYVGRVELEVDLSSGAVHYRSAELIDMDHQVISPDTTMIAKITNKEKEICPEAETLLGVADRGMGVAELARLAAQAFARRGRADLGCCHVGLIFRDALPSGRIDLNAVFRTGGQRGETLVLTALRGELLRKYQEELVRTRKGKTTLANASGEVVVDTLDPLREYKVILPEREWSSRLVKVLGQDELPDPTPVQFTFTEALAEEVRTRLRAF